MSACTTQIHITRQQKSLGRDLNPGPAAYEAKEGQNGVISEYRAFCAVDLQLSRRTIRGYIHYVRKFLQWLGDGSISSSAIREYLLQPYFSQNGISTYANALKALKAYCRCQGHQEWMQSFRFPRAPFQPKTIPSREELCEFYDHLESARDRALFLFFASSGLRRSEALGLHREEVDLVTHVVKPRQHSGRTKRVFLTFIKDEAALALKKYLGSRKDDNPKLFPMATISERGLWRQARTSTGIQLKPQLLREWFCMEMGCLGVPDRFIDAFCGRVPTSVLARHYTDYSLTRLKEIYDRANLRILSQTQLVARRTHSD